MQIVVHEPGVINTIDIPVEENMKFDEYQAMTAETAIYPKYNNSGVPYVALGLTGEAGEVAENVKKAMRVSEDLSELPPERRQKIKLELGDVLWYLARMASELDLTLSEIACANIEKLQQRAREGKLKER